MVHVLHPVTLENGGTPSTQGNAHDDLKQSMQVLHTQYTTSVLKLPSVSLDKQITSSLEKKTFQQDIHRTLNMAPVKKDKINLASKDHPIMNLRSIKHIPNLLEMIKTEENPRILLFDLAINNASILSNLLNSYNSETIKYVHMPLPNTLIKRPKFDFDKLLATAIYDENKKKELQTLINHSNIFLFYDGVSTHESCLFSTYWFIKKFDIYRNNGNGTKKYLMEGNNYKLQTPIAKSFKETPQNSPKFNLTIAIPQVFTPGERNSMFVQSIKKDSVHYSPTSLKKYFQFKVPDELLHNDMHLPVWLSEYVVDTQSKREEILEKLLSKFELLEVLETERLQKCINKTTVKAEPSGKENIPSRHSIYSIPYLQNQFKKQKMERGTMKPLNPGKSLKVIIPSQSSSLRDSTRGSLSSPMAISNSNQNSPSTTPDCDSLLTPLGFYEISQGIQSFTRNRYSNILPYEHSRVKLLPSPINSRAENVIPPLETSTGSSPLKINMDSSYFDSNLLELPPKNDSSETFNDYFNANYLSLSQVNPNFNYIATQSPLPSTIDDFWKVVISNKVQVIISLISEDELQMRKWDIYWNSDSVKKHSITVDNTYENVLGIDGCILRIFKVKKHILSNNVPIGIAEDDRTVYQLQYTKWLDSCGIDMHSIIKLYYLKNAILNNPTAVLDGINLGDIDKYQDIESGNFDLCLTEITNNLSPVLVHCSAGCGRTGVFITLDFLMNILDTSQSVYNKIDVWNMKEDLLFIIINELRKQRISMVQNLTQFITCYESLLKYFAL